MEKILNMPVDSMVDWKFGLITRQIYRESENRFEIMECSDGFISAIVTKDVMAKLLTGETSIIDIEFS